MPVETYNPEMISIQINGLELPGWNSVTIERSTDRWIAESSTDGIPAHRKDPDPIVNFTIEMNKACWGNDIPPAVRAMIDTEFTLSFVDNSLTEIFNGESCHLRGQPPIGREKGEPVFTIEGYAAIGHWKQS